MKLYVWSEGSEGITNDHFELKFAINSTKVLSDTLCIFAGYFKEVKLWINSTNGLIMRA